MEEESLFWADQIAREVKARVSEEPTLQKVVKEKGYICYDEKTPSGRIHIGSARGWIIHDTVAKSLRELKLKARFILSSDDFDPMDAIPPGLDKNKYEKFLGIPMKNVPSPNPNYKSFADYYFNDSTEIFPEYGINAELERTSQHYENGDFNKYIKLALDNSEKIQSIYEGVYGKVRASEKLPFNPICEKCGKIGTTLAYEWDSEREVVKYKCKEDLVEWASGCGHESEISPYDGNGKLPWKIEWAAKWPAIGVVYETAGKDHFTKGSSRDIAVRVCEKIFNYPPPYPSSRDGIGKGYEFFTVGGKKMSTSKGIGLSFREISSLISPKILKYLVVRTRPHAVIDFDPLGTNKLILLYDNYDRTERIYFDLEKADTEKETAHEKRAYELSHIGKISEKIPPEVPLSLASMVVQTVNFNIEKSIAILHKIKKVPKKLSAAEHKYLTERLRDAISFVKEFAPEEYKFAVSEKVNSAILAQLSDMQKSALKKLAEDLKKEHSQEELEKHLYDLAKKFELKSNEFFSAAYLVLIGKEKGPRLAPFLLSLDRKFLIERFSSVM